MHPVSLVEVVSTEGLVHTHTAILQKTVLLRQTRDMKTQKPRPSDLRSDFSGQMALLLAVHLVLA